MILLNEDNEVFVCGNNEFGQLGLGNYYHVYEPTKLPIKVLSVAYNFHHTIFITEDGTYGCGDNELGQLGLGDIDKVNTPTKLPIDAILVSCKDFNTAFITENGVDIYGDNVTINVPDFRYKITDLRFKKTKSARNNLI